MANGTTLGTAYVQIVPSAQGIKGSIENALGGETVKAGNNLGNKLGSTIKTAIVAAGIGAAIAKSLTAGGALQQALGGVETMFGDSADKVIANADKAFQTAGVSANTYLEQVTSFSATLLQGLEGDTEAAVKYADMAIVDMSDNANKFGTDISSIQAAYQGFAKDNYTLLDNLKLGYGGTAGEMARLINDTQVLGDNVVVTAETVKDVPFDKIIEAIHKVQEDLGVTGTTSVEAAETFSGSMASMKAALENVLANASLGRDMQPALEGLASTVKSFFLDNLFPMIQNIVSALPEMLDVLTTVMEPMMPAVIDGLVQILTSVTTMMIKFIPELINAAISMAGAIIDALTKVDWGAVAIQALDAIKQSFEKHPIATTIALSLGGLKILGQSISSIAALALSQIKGMLATQEGLTPLGKGLMTVMQLAIGFGLVYSSMANLKGALDTESMMDDILEVVKGAFGGALIGAKIGGVAGALIGASVVVALELIITMFHTQDQHQAEMAEAFQAVRDEWIETNRITQEQADILEAALSSQHRTIRVAAQEIFDVLEDTGTISEETAASLAYQIEALARDMGITISGTADDAESTVQQSSKVIIGNLGSTKKTLETYTSGMSTTTQRNFSTMSSGVNKTLSGMANSSVSSAAKLMSGFNGTISQNSGKTTELANTLKSNFLSPVNTLPDATSTSMKNTLAQVTGSQANAKKYAGDLGNAITASMKSATTNVSINMQETMAQTLRRVSSQQSAASLAGQNIGNAIANGISMAVRAVPNQIAAIMAQTVNTAYSYIQRLRNVFSSTSFRFNQYIPMPHFYMYGSFNAQSGSVPYVGVSWYKQAAEYGALFDSPQIIGVGDASQPELLIGEDKLREIVGSGQQVTINVYPQKGQSEEAIATMVMRKIQHAVNKKGAVFA